MSTPAGPAALAAAAAAAAAESLSAGGAGGAAGFGGGAGGTPLIGIPFGGGGGGGAGLGGAIFSNGGVVTLVNDTFTGNAAEGGAFGTGGFSGTPGSGYGGAVFAVNGTLSAKFVTFSGNTAEDGSSPTPTPLDGTDVYVLSDGGGAGVNGSGAVTAILIDDILGQATFATSDFVADSVSGGDDPLLTGQNDLISNNSPTISGSTGLTGTAIATARPRHCPAPVSQTTPARLTRSP